ncbi:MAG: GcrA family cell cycle regulator [Bacillota bacterium]
MGALIQLPKGKPWTREEEKQLRDLREKGCKVSEIATAMGKSEEAVMKKLQRIGLKVVQQSATNWTTTTTPDSEIILPKELYSIEEALGILAGAMKALQASGLPKTEVLRLRSLIQAASLYQVKFAEYIDYRGTEKRLVELNRKYEELVRREPVQNKPIETKQETIGTEQEIIEEKSVENIQVNDVEVTKEGDKTLEENGNQNQP